MRVLLTGYMENLNVTEHDLKHDRNLFSELTGDVPFCNSGRLTLSEKAF